MPARQPFTALCQALARPAPRRQADLHLHTTHSDGTADPAGLLVAARGAGLQAIAVTDHDTLGGYLAAIDLPVPPSGAWPALEIVPGVEITSSFLGREVHLLAYDVRPNDPSLAGALAELRVARVERFRAMAGRLAALGASVEGEALRLLVDESPAAHTLGRRHLAGLLVQAGRARNVREAFQRYLHDGGRASVPKERLAADRALTLAHAAGGVVSLAHPPADWGREELAGLLQIGLDAVEVDFPSCRPARAVQLREWAAELGLAVSGGSDWHGPSATGKHVGACGVSLEELGRLRAGRAGV
jgi:predicted metal-dependent phosphoesterase TrpH